MAPPAASLHRPAFANFLEEDPGDDHQRAGGQLRPAHPRHLRQAAAAKPQLPRPRYHDPAWTKPNLGQLFGLTLDSDGNIYVAATTVYGANPAPNTIKEIDGKTGKISVFATLPNNGRVRQHQHGFAIGGPASNHEDGRIYQIDMTGTVVSTTRRRWFAGPDAFPPRKRSPGVRSAAKHGESGEPGEIGTRKRGKLRTP